MRRFLGEGSGLEGRSLAWKSKSIVGKEQLGSGSERFGRERRWVRPGAPVCWAGGGVGARNRPRW